MRCSHWYPLIAAAGLMLGCSQSKDKAVATHVPAAPDSFSISDLVPAERFLASTDTRAYVETAPGKPKSVTLIKKDAGSSMEFVVALNGSVASFRISEDGEMSAEPFTPIKTQDGKIVLGGDQGLIQQDWFEGAEHTFLGTVKLGPYQFVSDANLPLVFQVVKDSGYVYLCGRGTVQKDGGARVKLGARQDASDWIGPLAKGTPLQKQGAGIALGYYRDKSAVPALIAATRDTSSWKVRRDAVEALGRIGDPAAAPALAAAVTDEKELIGPVALEALARVGASGLPHIKKYLAGTEKEKKFREHAVYALGASPDPEALTVLTGLIHSAKDSDIHKIAVSAVAKIGKPQCVPVLIEALKSSTNGTVRTAAVTGLGKMAGSKNADAILPALQEAAAKDKDADVRKAAEAVVAQHKKAS